MGSWICLPLQEEKSRQVQIPSNLLKHFCEVAWRHAPTEFMGWITGTMEFNKKEKRTILYGNGLWLPLQGGDMHTVMEPIGNGPVPQHMETTGSVVIGWIHSHPTFAAFFSSVDQHMQHLLQKDLPLAFGIVVDQDKNPRVLRLSPKGMKEIESCDQEAGFGCDLVFKMQTVCSSLVSCFSYNYCSYDWLRISAFEYVLFTCLDKRCKTGRLSRAQYLPRRRS